MTAAGYSLSVTDGTDGSSVVTVEGDIDVTNVGEFAKSVEEIPAARPAILDFRQVRYLDSAGFAALADILETRPVAIVIPHTSPVRRAAALMSLPCHPTVDLARDAVCGPGS
jgi:anti-anti-sigma factor